MTFDYGKWYYGWRWGDDRYWLYPFNWLSAGDRYWGYYEPFYDGPMPTFGLWFFNVSWRW